MAQDPLFDDLSALSAQAERLLPADSRHPQQLTVVRVARRWALGLRLPGVDGPLHRWTHDRRLPMTYGELRATLLARAPGAVWAANARLTVGRVPVVLRGPDVLALDGTLLLTLELLDQQ